MWLSFEGKGVVCFYAIRLICRLLLERDTVRKAFDMLVWKHVGIRFGSCDG